MSEHLVHALSGAGGGIISMALTYPLISVSTLQQVNKAKKHQSQFDILRAILKKDGVKGLYSGLKSALVGNAVTQAVYYYFYELVKAGFEARYAANQSISLAENMLTGGIAGAVTSIVTNPIWVINTRLMTKDAQSVGIRQAAVDIYKEDGFLGFMRGLIPALILVCNPIIQFTVFERVKQLIEKKRGELTRLDFFLLGAFSKLCATGITYPYIVVKSRMHLKDDATTKYKSIWDCFRKIIKAEGIFGLYRGIESKLLQSILTAAFTFAAKEELYNLTTRLLEFVNIRQTVRSVEIEQA